MIDGEPWWLIPTYAGNTNSRPRGASPGSAHPHVCGEHVCQSINSAQRTGSSPRMRGTRHVGRFHPDRVRLIPTYAGNTVTNNPAPLRG